MRQTKVEQKLKELEERLEKLEALSPLKKMDEKIAEIKSREGIKQRDKARDKLLKKADEELQDHKKEMKEEEKSDKDLVIESEGKEISRIKAEGDLKTEVPSQKLNVERKETTQTLEMPLPEDAVLTTNISDKDKEAIHQKKQEEIKDKQRNNNTGRSFM